MTTLLLTKEQVRGLIRMPDVIDAVETAYRAFNSDQVEQPAYMGLHLTPGGAEIDFKAAHNRADALVSLKASSGGFTDNLSQFGLPNGMGTVMLFDARSGALLCVMDGSLLTGFRTGAAGAVSVKALARRDARTVAVIGTGGQARMQIRAIREVMSIEQVYAVNRSSAGLAAFKSEIEGEFGIPVNAAATAQDAVAQADIVITTTRATGVVLQAEWLRPGTHIIAIGADQTGKQELDPEIFRNARIVVDSLVQCAAKGELQYALQQGIVTAAHAEIGEILLAGKPGRESEEEITLFDSTGMAIQDTTTAAMIFRLARQRGTGTAFNFLAQDA